MKRVFPFLSLLLLLAFGLKAQNYKVLSMSDKERKRYEWHIDNKLYEEDVVESAHEDGWFEGYNEGEAEAYKKMKLKLKALGFDEQTITEIVKSEE